MTSENAARSRSADGPRALDVVIQFDGTLTRFGFVLPEAEAMLANVHRTAARYPGRVRTFAVRLLGASSQQADSARALAADVTRAGLARYFQPLNERCLVLSSFSDLQAHGFDPKPSPGKPFVALLSALAGPSATGLAAGWVSWQLSSKQIPGARRLPYEDVGRMVQEAIRAPVPRPRSPGSRQGAALERAGLSLEQAFSLVLQVARRDDQVEWVFSDGCLFLYVEWDDNVEKLRRLGMRAISDRVHKTDLVLERALPAHSSWTVRDARASHSSPSVVRETLPWSRARGRSLVASPVPTRTPAIAELTARALEIAEALSSEALKLAAATRWIERLLGPEAAIDASFADAGSVRFSSAAARPGADVVLVGHALAWDEAHAAAIGVAIAMAAELSRSPSPCAVLHGMSALRAEEGKQELCDGLLEAEQARVGAVLVVNHEPTTADPDGRLGVACSDALRAQLVAVAPPEVLAATRSTGEAPAGIDVLLSLQLPALAARAGSRTQHSAEAVVALAWIASWVCSGVVRS